MSVVSASEPLTVLIVGCGDIAGGYDECSGSEEILSHAGAYSRDPRFQICACVEPNSKRREAFMAYWNIKEGYHDLASCLASNQSFDLVSLCLPTREHGEARVVRLHGAGVPGTDGGRDHQRRDGGE